MNLMEFRAYCDMWENIAHLPLRKLPEYLVHEDPLIRERARGQLEKFHKRRRAFISWYQAKRKQQQVSR